MQVVVLVLVLVSFCAGQIDVPGCGKISEIRWNNTCVQSSTKRLANKNFNILRISNLLLFDGIFYYIVPHATEQDKAHAMSNKLKEFMGNEVEFLTRNISRSPLKFGDGDGGFSVKKVLEFESSVVLQESNLQEFGHPAPPYLEYIAKLPYVSTATVYNFLCRLLQQCKGDDKSRESSLIITSSNNSFHLDWENGVSANCFASQEIFPVQMSKQLSQTLFILRNVVMYQQLSPHNNLYLPTHIQQQCVQSGFGHDSSANVQDSKEYNVSMCTIFKNEQQYLLEWIAHHTLSGVDHFFLYNDYSDDDSLKLLQPLIQQSLVTLHNISDTLLNMEVGKKLSVQKHCSYNYQRSSKWLIPLDVDEFIVVKEEKYGGNIQNWINANPILRNQTGSVQIVKEELAGQYYPLQQGQLLTAESIYKYNTQLNDFKVLANTNGLDYVKDRVAFSFMPIRSAGLIEDCVPQHKFDTRCTAPQVISIYHYIVKYYNTTFVGESANVNVNASIVPEHGKSHQFWQLDDLLANQEYTKKICLKMKQLNLAWYEEKKLCDNYDFM